MKRHKEVAPCPQKVFGEIRVETEISPTLKASDYKSPHWVIEYEET